MLTINRVMENGTCVFCSKEKEVAAVILDGQGEILLCWADVRKIAQMRMRMLGQPKGKPEVKAAVPIAAPANGAK